jgi:hypothetical protein
MMIQSPAQVASNRTARLVHEQQMPVYSTDTERARARVTNQRIRWAEEFTHSEDEDQPWCHVCARPTDHFGEHSDEQLLEFYHGKGRYFRR